ncbi:MAG: response regulator [Bacteriovoracaceae bacterium]|nr:response regulator [Bacteriovoracaceae bacterium]
MKSILIIEDEVLIAQSLKKLLEKRGHKVQTTESGIEAIKYISETNFDRIVCDLMLQDISGFDVLEESRKKYSQDQIGKIFIIMTAYNSPQVLEKASEYECEILNKPFEDLKLAMDKIEGSHI